VLKRTLLTAASVLVLSATAPATVVATSGTVSAAKQRLQILDISDHCMDEFDEDVIVYVSEGSKDCTVKIRVTGRGQAKSKVALEYYSSDEGWTRSARKVQVTSTSGRAIFVFDTEFPTDPDSYCYDDEIYTYRFAVATSGRFRSFRSSTFEVVYDSADDNPACTGDGSDDDYWEW